MVSERNRILDLVQYLESLGIEVNIGKNKARGNKGFFKFDGSKYRIDIAKGQNEDVILKTLAHEFAHFVHYQYDKTLKSLDFIFDDSEYITKELLDITVEMIPKVSVEPLFTKKENLKTEISDLEKELDNLNLEILENKIKFSPLKYLLKYDRVKVFEGFSFKMYKVEDLKPDNDIEKYIILRSKQRHLKRINSKIARLNKYFNSPSELFARAFEMYIANKNQLKELAPRTFAIFEENYKKPKILELSTFLKKIL